MGELAGLSCRLRAQRGDVGAILGGRQPLVDARVPDLLVDELATTIGRDPETTPRRAAVVAYRIVCLSETNTVLLDVGFPERYSDDAAMLARSSLKAG